MHIIYNCNTTAVNAELYVKSKEEFAYLSEEILRQTVMDRDKDKGSFKFPAIIRCCCLLLLWYCWLLLFPDCFGSGSVSWTRILKRKNRNNSSPDSCVHLQINDTTSVLFSNSSHISCVNLLLAFNYYFINKLQAFTFSFFRFMRGTSNLQVHVCNESLVPLCFLWAVCSRVFSSVLLLPDVCQTTDRSGFLHLVELVCPPIVLPVHSNLSRGSPWTFPYHRACYLL